MSLQIAILGVGAWLVLAEQMTPGAMIAGSILFARALAPVDQAIGSWRSATSARSAYQRITAQLRGNPPRPPAMALPPPTGRLKIDGADVADWDPADVERYIGYLPQDIELFAGTVRENIARMSEGDPRPSSPPNGPPTSMTWCSIWRTATRPRLAAAWRLPERSLRRRWRQNGSGRAVASPLAS